MFDNSKLLTKEGVINICKKYGIIKKVTLHKNIQENHAFIEFEDEAQSIYFGPNISGSSLIEESNQLKFKSQTKLYNLDNDDLFGRPMNTKWEKIEKPFFELNNQDFYYRFENCTGGQIKIEKMLGPKIFTGWTTFFNDGENVQDTLKNISNDIELSESLKIYNLKNGMLVGAFDNVTNLYGRGYVTLVAGNTVNVTMCDFGKIINTNLIRVLPEKYSKIPAYSFKIYSKDNFLLLKDKPYVFKVRSASSERIVLILFDEKKEIKVQLKKWQATVEEFGVPYIDFKSGSFVELLKLKDMNSVYIRSKQKYQLELIFSFWNSIAAYCYKNSHPLNREPVYGEIVGFKSTLNNNYVRGRIHKYLGNNIYSVKHMDNPYKENIKLSEMIELQFEHKSLPVCFLKVKLKNALQYPIQFEAEKFIKHVIGIRLSVNFDETKIDGWKHVDLNITIVRENLNAILLSLAEPSWFDDEPKDLLEASSNYCKDIHVKHNKLVEKSIVNMKFVMYHEGIFYMRDKLFGKSFSLLSSMIKEYCSLSLNPYLPHNGEVCLGQFPDGMWYRIKCENVKAGELAEVYSIDLGIVAFLSFRHIKKLPAELLFHPSHVFRCILDSTKPIQTNKLQLLQKYENTDCEFTVVKNLDDEDYYSISCSFLEDILIPD
ncbi:uncharacterized protein LOC112694531 isoform X1 [Sipha flava]|uniref:Uncharacterized protein LOC112694531 isoform X1 n=1 Tax=Sipha flava TaxID=143950 RepID=A0A8B8GRC2_9HEMI|nr:uncharacterized protein LOC112694531 isoform X1 [Sipha flava]